MYSNFIFPVTPSRQHTRNGHQGQTKGIHLKGWDVFSIAIRDAALLLLGASVLDAALDSQVPSVPNKGLAISSRHRKMPGLSDLASRLGCQSVPEETVSRLLWIRPFPSVGNPIPFSVIHKDFVVNGTYAMRPDFSRRQVAGGFHTL
jgi:hypothetical protein